MSLMDDRHAGGRALSAHLDLQLLPSGEDATVTGSAAVRPDLCRADGSLRIGVLATLLDSVGGLVTGMAVLPDWVVTADLSVRTWGPTTGGAAGNRVHGDAHLLRRGRSTSIGEVRLHAGDPSAPCGAGVITSGVLTPDFPLPAELGQVMVPPHRPDPPDGYPPLPDWLGVVARPDGAELAVHPKLANPWGMVHGGVTAMLCDLAAEAVTGRVVDDLLVRYLRPARIGPVRATVHESGPGTVRAVVTDEGADARVVAHAILGLGAPDSG
jgi:acyl-coenzyme A thioesterase PaaI-like protein